MDALFRNSRRKLSQGLLFWREVGKGTPVIFLHGAWNDSSQWVSIMESLSPDIHCFAPDLLGFGESESPNIHHSIDLQVECLAEFLQALKLEKISLVGHSLGGWIAVSYALKYAEKVSNLVLLAPEGVEVEGQKQSWQKMQRLVKCSPIIVKLLTLLNPLTKIIGFQKTISQDLQFREILLQYPTASHLLFNRKQPEIEAELVQNNLHSLQVPCLIIQGSQDNPNAIAKSNIYARLIPKVELKIIDHGENNLPELSAAVVAENIRDFLKKNN